MSDRYDTTCNPEGRYQPDSEHAGDYAPMTQIFSEVLAYSVRQATGLE